MDWIEPIKDTLLTKRSLKGYWEQQQKSPTWNSWAGYAFESICYKHIAKIAQELNISPTAIPDTWRYVPRKKPQEQGAQIDLLFDRDDDAIQANYLRNLIGPEMGSNKPMKFNHHAKCLYLPLINRTKEEVLTELYRYILSENRFISTIQNKINHYVRTESAYTTLFELTKEWVDVENKEETDDVTKMYIKNITEQGVVDLLLSVGVLEKSNSLFAG